MEFTTQVALPVSVDRVMELRTDESLLRKAAEHVNADLISISVVPVEGGAFTIEQVRRVSSELLPGAMRGFVPAQVDIVVVEAWAEKFPDDDTRIGTFAIRAGGVPVVMNGKVTLQPRGETCEIVWMGDVTASVPLFADMVERAVRDVVVATIHDEAAAFADMV